jgi:hypothetical protein
MTIPLAPPLQRPDFVAQIPVLRLASFTALMVVLGALAAWVGWLAADALGAEGAAWAVGLCLLPGWIVLMLESRMQSPKQFLMLVLIGTGVRLAVAAGGAVAILKLRPEMPRQPFLLSLLVLYLASLMWETKTLARGLAHGGVSSAGPVA